MRVSVRDNVKDISSKDDRFEISTQQGIFEADAVALARGSQGRIGKRNKKSRFGLSVEVDLTRPHHLSTVRIFARAGYQIFCTPVEDKKMNVSFLGPLKIIQEIFHDYFNETMSELSQLLQVPFAHISKPLGAGPFHYRARKPVQDGAILIGDSYQTLDPIGGMGMSAAFIAAYCGTRYFIDVFLKNYPKEKAFRDYEHNILRHTRIPRLFTRLAFHALDTCGSRIATYKKPGMSRFLDPKHSL